MNTEHWQIKERTYAANHFEQRHPLSWRLFSVLFFLSFFFSWKISVIRIIRYGHLLSLLRRGCLSGSYIYRYSPFSISFSLFFCQILHDPTVRKHCTVRSSTKKKKAIKEKQKNQNELCFSANCESRGIGTQQLTFQDYGSWFLWQRGSPLRASDRILSGRVVNYIALCIRRLCNVFFHVMHVARKMWGIKGTLHRLIYKYKSYNTGLIITSYRLI